MKYIVIDEKNGDMFASEHDNRQDAITAAKDEWSRLSDHDKKHRIAFYVLESVNPNEDALDHFDGDIILDMMEEK